MEKREVHNHFRGFSCILNKNKMVYQLNTDKNNVNKDKKEMELNKTEVRR